MAEDITSTVFEKALTKFTSFQPEKANFSTWVFAIARNAVIDHYRISRKEKNVPLDDVFAFSNEGDHPDDELVKKEEREIMQTCIAKLSPHEQEIISLKFGAEMTNRQIANDRTIRIQCRYDRLQDRKLRDTFGR
jgi:RNA polymerase sigma-70 factor (ECF subfamily)